MQGNIFSLLFLFLLVVANKTSLNAQTYVGQHIERYTKWSKVGSPYIITMDIIVRKGATLEIEPGTKILFSKETRLIIDGNLRAKGTASKKIAFSGLRDGAWNGFLFLNACTDYNEESDEGCLFEYCTFKGIGEKPDQLIRSKGCNLRVSHCTIENCYTAVQSERQARIIVDHSTFKYCNRAINVRNTSMANISNNKILFCNSIVLGGTTTFTGNTLKKFTSKGRHSGVIVWMLGGGIITIENNSFLKFEDYAVKLHKMSRRSTFNLRGNNFKDNKVNLQLACNYFNRGTIAIEHNNFYNFGKYHIKLFSSCENEGSPELLPIGPNYWGKLSSQEVKQATLDGQMDDKINGEVQLQEPLNKKTSLKVLNK